MPGANRVVVGLPDRYEKAKREIAKLERRIVLARHIAEDCFPRTRATEELIKTLEGEHDND